MAEIGTIGRWKIILFLPHLKNKAIPSARMVLTHKKASGTEKNQCTIYHPANDKSKKRLVGHYKSILYSSSTAHV